MPSRKNLAKSDAITFRIGDSNFWILTGQTRDFLSVRPKNGEWQIMDDAATEAVLARLTNQVARLKGV